MKTMERLILNHLHSLVSSSLDLLQFAYQPGIGVDDAIIYLLHRSLSHLEHVGSTVRVMLFDFSSAFNTIQPSLLRGKLEGAGVDCHLTAWTIDYLTNRPQCVRLHNCVSDAVCSMGAPQGKTSDFTHNTDHCHIQKFSDDTAIIGHVSDGNELANRGVIKDFVDWCGINHLHINAARQRRW
ncbi:hypothetical protein LDENG_00002760 [Lucifuga dentata]|nr:hypothetical protein LDENG_00002760 [Lucifuga dentata]